MPNFYKEIKFTVNTLAKKDKIRPDEAFVFFMLGQVLGLEDCICDDAIEAGGPKDCGIDAFWNDRESVYILQGKFYKQTNKVKESDVDNLGNTLLYLENKKDAVDLSHRCKKYIKEKIEDYQELKKRGLDTCLILATSSKLCPAAATKLKLLQNKLDPVRIELIDAEEIVKKLINNRKTKKPVVDLMYKKEECFEFAKSKGKKAPYAVASVNIVSLYEAYKEHKGAIFAQNLRYFLGRGGKINKEIIETIRTKERDNFWYYNNGLTIVCDDFNVREKESIIHIENMQIVNGAQTTRSIYEALLDLGKERAANINVMCRIIKIKEDVDLLDNIRDFNNRQNPTKSRDFISHNKLQLELQEKFKPLGYYYEIKRGEKSEPSVESIIKKRKLKVVDNLTVAQAQYSFMGHPAEAKSQKSALLDLEDGFYNDIFPTGISANELLLSYLCYKEAKINYLSVRARRKELTDKDQYLEHGTTHIVSIMGLICNRIFDLSKVLYDTEVFNKITADQFVHEVYEEASGILGEIYDDLLHLYKNQDMPLVPSKFFKNSSDAEHILKLANRKIGKREQELIKTLMALIEVG